MSRDVNIDFTESDDDDVVTVKMSNEMWRGVRNVLNYTDWNEDTISDRDRDYADKFLNSF